jgi:hypothetical protein
MDVGADLWLSSGNAWGGLDRSVKRDHVSLRSCLVGGDLGRDTLDVLLAVPELLSGILYGRACEPVLGTPLWPLRTGTIGMSASSLPLEWAGPNLRTTADQSWPAARPGS